MKGRIALCAGYFVAMLLLAAYLTGVLQEGVLSRFRHQATAPQRDEHARDPSTSPQESDHTSATAPAPVGVIPAGPLDEKPSVQPMSQQPVVSVSNPSEQASASTAPFTLSSSDQEKLLAEKRAEFLRLEEQIRKRKAENEIEEKWLAELKASGAKITKERDARREAGIRKLAKLYEGMEPEAAASILSKLKKDMATEVLASMKDRQASRVLAAMNGQKAKELSERLEEARLDQPVGQGKTLRPGIAQAGEVTP